jgi:gluconolactonase
MTAPEPRVVTTGLAFPEGPVFLEDGSVVVTEIAGQCLTRVVGGQKSLIARTGGGANGATLGADGAIWVANNGGVSLGPAGYWFPPEPIDGKIQRATLDGAIGDVATDLPGAPPHRPNDLCFGPDGGLYFTDPRNWEDIANLQPGRLCRFDRATREVRQIAEVLLFCNGIAFGPDDKLYVAQSMGMKIIAFAWTPDGLGDPADYASLPKGFPDGFCFSSDGDCYVCGSMGDVIQVFDAAGALKETIELPEGTEPTNCCIGDGTLFVTCSGTGELIAYDLGIEPLPLYPFRS